MAGAKRTTTRSLKDELFQHPYRFQFFQAVRLMRWIRLREHPERPPGDIGRDYSPSQECVRLSGVLASEFPATEVAKIAVDEDPQIPAELATPVMGLFGAMGVLPTHDTQRLIDDRRDSRFEREFLDLFNHRVLSLFYRAWAKNYLPVQYEATYDQYDQSTSNLRSDIVSFSFLALAGLGLDTTRQKLPFADELPAFFSGHFSRQPKAASALKQMIEAVHLVPTRVKHFVGKWIALDDENRSEMPSTANPLGQHCELGMSFVLGDRIWEIGNQFRVTLGPLDYSTLLSFCPWEKRLQELFQLIRGYVGPQLEFEVQFELLASEIPRCQLDGQQALGVNTWLNSLTPTENSLDVVFPFDPLAN